MNVNKWHLWWILNVLPIFFVFFVMGKLFLITYSFLMFFEVEIPEAAAGVLYIFFLSLPSVFVLGILLFKMHRRIFVNLAKFCPGERISVCSLFVVRSGYFPLLSMLFILFLFLLVVDIRLIGDSFAIVTYMAVVSYVYLLLNFFATFAIYCKNLRVE